LKNKAEFANFYFIFDNYIYANVILPTGILV